MKAGGEEVCAAVVGKRPGAAARLRLLMRARCAGDTRACAHGPRTMLLLLQRPRQNQVLVLLGMRAAG